jgi:hypothetical protein
VLKKNTNDTINAVIFFIRTILLALVSSGKQNKVNPLTD